MEVRIKKPKITKVPKDAFKYRGGPLLHEGFTPHKAPLIKKFVEYTCSRLNIDEPHISIINSPTYSQQNKSFGGYMPSEQKILCVVHNRNMADILRTLAHEWVHEIQNENIVTTPQLERPSEDHANSLAGYWLRMFIKENPEHETEVYKD